MIYDIFRNNILLASVKPTDQSQLSQKKEAEDIVKLFFTLEENVKFLVGDYIIFEKTEQKYYLNKQPQAIESPKNYQYECIFEGRIHELRKTKVFLTTAKTVGSYIDYKFPLTGNAETFLLFIVDNLNRTGTGYTIGTFKSTETTTIDFNNWNVLEAVTEMAKQLEFDWWLNDKEVNFDSKTVESSYVFQVGRLLGFIELTRLRVENENIETVVYGYGSTENLPPRTADEGQTYDSPLLTENRLAFKGVDSESKVENNVETYGKIESVQEFEDIKPEFTGQVTSLGSTERIFHDTSIDFDINEQLLAGIVPKITFLTGKLIGLTFNISYVDSNQEITMDYYTDESGEYPNDIIFAEVGDQYKLFDLMMPESNITDAETRLEAATQSYIDKQSNPLVAFSGKLDKGFIRTYNIVLNLGDLIRIISSAFEIDNLYEINELTQNITEPEIYSVKFGDVLPKGLLATLRNINFETQQSSYTISRTSVTNNNITNIIGEDIEWERL